MWYNCVMAQDDRNKLNRLEELKGRLFSKDYKPTIEHRDNFSHFSVAPVPDDWADKEKPASNLEEKFFMKTSFFKKFFIFSIIFFVLALGYAGYVFFAGGNTVSNDNIDIAIVGNTFTPGGEPLPFVVTITNRNSSPLLLSDLVMEYPKGSTGDLTSNTENFRESLGTIPSGAVMNENMSVTLFGEQGATRPVKITLEYRVNGSNAIFVKEKDFDVTISSTPINISVDAPPSVSPDQTMTLNIKTTLNSTTPLSGVLVQVSYPPGFQFTSSVPAPAFNNNTWNLGDLSPGAEKDISVTGKMVGVFDGEAKTFQISSGSQSSTDKSMIDVVYNSVAQTVTVQKPFIEAVLSINGASETSYATDSKTSINATIQWTNNLDTSVNDLQIVAHISGNAFDQKTVQGQQGFYNSADNTITWDKTSESQFAEVNPGDSGTVSFSLSPLSLFSAAGGILNSPTINIEVDISGKQSVQGYATTSLTNSTSAAINIISDVGFSNKALYYSGPFTNTGPITPKAVSPTTYTIVWTLSDTANSISNAQVTSTLPSWITFVGPISPTTEDLTYDASTGQIVWNVDRILQGTGITSASRSVAFQVSLTPSISQVGTTPTIINSATLTGHDDFANVNVEVDKASLSTNLDSDSSFPTNGGIVSN